MNPLIYEPRGKAREYSPLALNIYRGCDHRCAYCYARGRLGQPDEAKPRAGLCDRLPRELDAREPIVHQVLLSFMGDPYCCVESCYKLMRSVLPELTRRGVPVAILTKGGSRCLRDLDLFGGAPTGATTGATCRSPLLKVGATLTFWDPAASAEWEPGAAAPADRLLALKTLHAAGIRTWVSMEPVIDPAQSLALIEASLDFVDEYKVGRWNHDLRANAIDWAAFGIRAVELIRRPGRSLYVKEDLRKYLSAGFLRAEECEQDRLALHQRSEAAHGAGRALKAL